MKTLLDFINARKKSAIAILSLAVLNVFLYGFVSYFQEPKLESFQKEWFERRRNIEGKQDKAMIYSQGKKDLETFFAKIPPKKDFIIVIGGLFEMATNNGLKIASVSYKPELMKGRDILNYTLNFSVTGDYAAIKSFISDLEHAPEIMTIDSVSLKNTDLSGGAVDFSVTISTFFKVDKI